MKTCVFIMGTNCTGKTSVARELLRLFGGIASEEESGCGLITITGDGKVAFAGRYEGVKFGGVDYLGKTKHLPIVAAYALSRCDCLVCEGMYVSSFGGNLTQTIYQAESRLVVCLYADNETISRRLAERSGTKITESVMKRQRTCATAAKNYGANGCAVRFFDTAATRTTEIAKFIYEWINNATK